MPIGPNLNDSGASMMQYTYLPRLVLAAAAVLPVWRILSDVRFSAARASRGDVFA